MIELDAITGDGLSYIPVDKPRADERLMCMKQTFIIISNMNSKYHGYIGILISKDKHGMWSQNHMPYSNQ